MKCLIDPRVTVQYISSWTYDPVKKHNIPQFSDYENSGRVCQVQEESFEIAPPLFWVDCADDVVADMFWYNQINGEINPVVDAPEPPLPPAEDQPSNTGTQQL